MATSSHSLKKNVHARSTSRRVGRGDGSGRGSFSGRGIKGQRARAGGKSGNARRSFMMNLRNIPKLRGFNSPKGKAVTVTLAQIEAVFIAGDVIAPHTLKKKGVVATIDAGVKIVSKGELTKAVTVKGCATSASAKAAIEKAGGTVAA